MQICEKETRVFWRTVRNFRLSRLSGLPTDTHECDLDLIRTMSLNPKLRLRAGEALGGRYAASVSVSEA